jgi:ABC-type phosphate transport system permease subunit
MDIIMEISKHILHAIFSALDVTFIIMKIVIEISYVIGIRMTKYAMKSVIFTVMLTNVLILNGSTPTGPL